MQIRTQEKMCKKKEKEKEKKRKTLNRQGNRSGKGGINSTTAQVVSTFHDVLKVNLLSIQQLYYFTLLSLSVLQGNSWANHNVIWWLVIGSS